MQEPEEVIERRFIELLSAAVPSVDVQGVLTPVEEGTAKVSDDTFISVFVDLKQPRTQYKQTHFPCDYTVRVTVHFAWADDPSGRLFRDTCRTVRTVLACLGGDGCSGLDSPGFACDNFELNSTSTALDQDVDVGGSTKTYTATVSGRIKEGE